GAAHLAKDLVVREGFFYGGQGQGHRQRTSRVRLSKAQRVCRRGKKPATADGIPLLPEKNACHGAGERTGGNPRLLLRKGRGLQGDLRTNRRVDQKKHGIVDR